MQDASALFPRRGVLNLPFVMPIAAPSEDPAKEGEAGPAQRTITDFTVKELCATLYGRRVREFALSELNPPGSPEFFMDLAGFDGAARDPVPYTGTTYAVHVKALIDKTNEALSTGFVQVRSETVAETVTLFAETEAGHAYVAYVAEMPNIERITAALNQVTLETRSDTARRTALSTYDAATRGVKRYAGAIAARATLDSRISAHLFTCIARSNVKRDEYRAELCRVITGGKSLPLRDALVANAGVVLPPDAASLGSSLGDAAVVAKRTLKSRLQEAAEVHAAVVEAEREALLQQHAYDVALANGANNALYNHGSKTAQGNRRSMEGEAKSKRDVAAAKLAMRRESAAKFPATTASFEVDANHCMATTNNTMLSYVAWWAVVTEATTGEIGEWAEIARLLRPTTDPTIANSAGMLPVQIANTAGPSLCIALRAALSE
jgi:hypothetical protein